MSNVKSVLFVCTGNSCRSVMAEGLMKKYLKELGKAGIETASAGIRGLDGLPPSEETIGVLKAEGVVMDGFTSKSVTGDMIKDTDLILVMEDIHKDSILRMAPEAAGKTFLLKEYRAPHRDDHDYGVGIPDPIGRPIEFYKYVLGLIKNEVKRIAEIL